MRLSSKYPGLLGGVSQKPPEVRSQHRHAEQINMLSDFVTGLRRRPGSYYGGSAALTSVDASKTRAYHFTVGGSEFAFIGSTGAQSPALTPMVVDKTARSFLTVNRTTDTVLDDLLLNGVGAATALGRFLVMTPAGATLTYTTTEVWAPESNQKRHVVWVRGGAYSRTFSVALIRGNQKFWVRYKTRDASYPLQLDTSDLDPSDPDYNKKINDRTNAYNSAALKWAGDALRDSTPENVAARLADEMRISGFLAPGATVEVVNSSICIVDSSVEEVEADDGGDGSLIRAAGNQVTAPEMLTVLSYPGKVIKVLPQDTPGALGFYMKAQSKDGSVDRFTEVTWEECAGTEYDITSAFVFATVEAGEAYVSSNLSWLSTQIGAVVPDYQPSVTGDADTAPVPAFFTKPITGLGVFQDRLLVAAGPDVTSSRPGDYLNFFRTSLLSQVDTDPVSFGIIGGEDDVLRHMLVWDRNLVIFGIKRPYVVSGRQPFTPGRVSATAMVDMPEADGTAPLPLGNFLFYTQRGDDGASVHQLRPGRSLETPLTEELTEELSDYISGDPVDLCGNATPAMLFVRGDGAANNVFVYQFLDTEDGRRTKAAWHRWVLSGDIVAMWTYNGELHLVHQRTTTNGLRAVLDYIRLEENTGPYLDSRLVSDYNYPDAHLVGSTYTVESSNLNGARAVPEPIPGDPDFASVTLLLKADDQIHGSTTLTDSSSYADHKTAPNSKVNTTDSIFGTSGSFEANGSAGVQYSSSRFCLTGLPQESWTIEGWFNSKSRQNSTATPGFVEVWYNNTTQQFLYLGVYGLAGTYVTHRWGTGDAPIQILIPGGVPVDGWVHWAQVLQDMGDGTVQKALFLNGQRVRYDPAAAGIGHSLIGGTVKWDVWVGGVAGATSSSLCLLDDVRVTTGVARYDVTQATYVIPAAEFPTSV